jgi:hypothetical protein
MGRSLVKHRLREQADDEEIAGRLKKGDRYGLGGRGLVGSFAEMTVTPATSLVLLNLIVYRKWA